MIEVLEQHYGVSGGRPLSMLRTGRPDLEVCALMNLLRLHPRRTTKGYTVAQARQDLRTAIWALGTREPVNEVTDRAIPGPNGRIPIRIYRPTPSKAGPLPALVWVYGGGFVTGDLFTGDGTCRALANRTGAIVIAVDYRKAPEHDLDAGRVDCLAALKWVAANGPDIGVDVSRLAVGGDSAGGNISAFMAQECARRGGPELCLQALVYPATDLANLHADTQDSHEGYFLTQEVIDWFKSHFTQLVDLDDPRFSPLHAPDLTDVAPAVVITAGFDPLRDEGLAYAERLRAAGIEVDCFHYPGQTHGFVSFDRVLRGARDALSRAGSALAKAFATPDQPELIDRPSPLSGSLAASDALLRGTAMQFVVDTMFAQLMVSEGVLNGWRWLLPGAQPEAARNRLAPR